MRRRKYAHDHHAQLNGRHIILDHFHQQAWIREHGQMVILPGAYWEWVNGLVSPWQAMASNA